MVARIERQHNPGSVFEPHHRSPYYAALRTGDIRSLVFARLDPAIHAAVQYGRTCRKALTCRCSAWIRGSSPRMTTSEGVTVTET